jgi:hypothetical protein
LKTLTWQEKGLVAWLQNTGLPGLFLPAALALPGVERVPQAISQEVKGHNRNHYH